MWKLWLIISGIFFIMEMLTVGFLVFWFGIGAIIAMCASFFVKSVTAQTAIFVVSSTILLFATRTFVNKFAKTENTSKTNAYSIEGKQGIVISEIDPTQGSGQIKVNGEIWSAKSFDNTCISQNSKVTIEKIDGVKMWFLIVVFIIIVILALKTIKVVRQSEVYIIERLGKFHKVAEAGLTIIIPFMDTVRSVVSLKQQTMDIPPQGVITSDNVTITIDTVVFYKITDPARAVYEIQSLKKGIEYLSITTIRDIVGKMELDETFSSRDVINEKLRVILDEATDAWGCKIDRVEIKDITPPADIRDAMEKQMNAERNKRALILQAEAERQSAITLAEGRKQAAILDAEADRESKIRRATGDAEAIKQVADAKAREIGLVYEAIQNANPSDKLVQLKSLEALQEVAKGEANKIFIPFDAPSALGSLGAIKDVMSENKKK